VLRLSYWATGSLAKKFSTFWSTTNQPSDSIRRRKYTDIKRKWTFIPRLLCLPYLNRLNTWIQQLTSSHGQHVRIYAFLLRQQITSSDMTSGALRLHNSTYLFPQVRGTFSLLMSFTPFPTDARVPLQFSIQPCFSSHLWGSSFQ
jgi:hypothetical protein